jgi:hypothetical protein
MYLNKKIDQQVMYHGGEQQNPWLIICMGHCIIMSSPLNVTGLGG